MRCPLLRITPVANAVRIAMPAANFVPGRALPLSARPRLRGAGLRGAPLYRRLSPFDDANL